MTSSQKREMLKSCWQPSENYDFHQDAIDPTRPFIHKWLKLYEPWLAYSKHSAGALCLYCVLFPPTTVKGNLGAFIAAPFMRFRKMHECAQNHISSQWHKDAKAAAKNFMGTLPVDVVMVSSHQKLIERNRKIISSIISTIIFCGSHDLALRGKSLHSGKTKQF